MVYTSKYFKTFLLIIIFASLWRHYICQMDYDSIVDKKVPSSYYEQLKMNLKPVLDRLNASAEGNFETDYDYSSNDNPDVEEPPAPIFEHKHRNITDKKMRSKYRHIRHKKNRATQDKSMNFIASNNQSNKFDNQLSSIKQQSSENSPASLESEDYDYAYQDSLDYSAPLTAIFDNSQNVQNLTQNNMESLAETLRHGEKSQEMGSLYEKYKAELDPLIKRFNLSSMPPSHHNNTFEYIEKNRKTPKHHSTANEYASLYDEFKKRLIDFSTELDIDAGLTDSKKSVDMLDEMQDKQMLQDTGNHLENQYTGKIHGDHEDHITAEFRKVQNIVDRIENDHRKRNDPVKAKKKDQNQLSKFVNAVDGDYLRDQYRIDTGRQTATNNGYVNNDYNYEEGYHPLPIFRKPDIPLKQRKRPLRGVENPWSTGRGTDGSSYSTFFPNVYSVPATKELGNISARSYLESIAQKLNMSTIDIAKKVAEIKGLDLSTLKKDPELLKLLQDYVENSVISAAHSAEISSSGHHSYFDAIPVDPPKILNIPDLSAPEQLPNDQSASHAQAHSPKIEPAKSDKNENNAQQPLNNQPATSQQVTIQSTDSTKPDKDEHAQQPSSNQPAKSQQVNSENKPDSSKPDKNENNAQQSPSKHQTSNPQVSAQSKTDSSKPDKYENITAQKFPGNQSATSQQVTDSSKPDKSENTTAQKFPGNQQAIPQNTESAKLGNYENYVLQCPGFPPSSSQLIFQNTDLVKPGKYKDNIQQRPNIVPASYLQVIPQSTGGSTNSGKYEDMQKHLPQDNRLSQVEIATSTIPPLTAANAKNQQTSVEMSEILEKLLNKLQEIKLEKSQVEGCNPFEDTPCKLNGSWISKAMGLRFDISLKDDGSPNSSTHEAKSQALNVSIHECTPPKPHDVIETDWPITGNALKGNGGPFFLYTQKHSENVLATFVGYCRNCGGTDTIYGTWSFSFPSKSCQDSPASFQTKNDVMRRYQLDEKREERYQLQLRHETKPWWRRY